MSWLFLGLAIVSEVFGSTMLKLSYGFSKPLPSLGVVLGFGSAFYFLSLAMKTISLATAYTVWSGVGIILTATISVLVFQQKIDLAGVLGIAIILIGIVILMKFSQMGSH